MATNKVTVVRTEAGEASAGDFGAARGKTWRLFFFRPPFIELPHSVSHLGRSVACAAFLAMALAASLTHSAIASRSAPDPLLLRSRSQSYPRYLLIVFTLGLADSCLTILRIAKLELRL
jgi:hypothetical protein